MKLKFREDKLKAQLRELLGWMKANSEKRESFYQKCRKMYYFGGDNAIVNRVRPIVERISSIIFSPQNTHWWIDVPQSEESSFDITVLESAMDFFNSFWGDVNFSLKVEEAVNASLIEGSSILCWGEQSNTPTLYRIPSGSFCVYREDEEDITRQESLAYRTYITEPELVRWAAKLEISEKIESFLRSVGEYWEERKEEKDTAVGRLIVTSDYDSNRVAIATTLRGIKLVTASEDMDYTARVAVPVLPVDILWVMDDFYHDYRVFFLTPSGEILWDSADSKLGGNSEQPNPFVKGEHPFWVVRPFSAQSYFWGFSLVHYLSSIQDWFNERLADFDKLFRKGLDPSLVVMSQMEITEDAVEAFRSQTGILRLPPEGKVQPVAPDLSNIVVEGFRMIQDALMEMATITPVLSGMGEKGVRSQDQYQQMLRASSAPLKKAALLLEAQLNRGGNLLWHWLRDNSDRRIFTRTGEHAILAQMSSEARVMIDGHSHSPVFMEDHLQIANLLLRNGVIGPEEYLDLVHPPLYGYLKARLPEIQRKQAQAAMMEMMAKGKGKQRR